MNTPFSRGDLRKQYRILALKNHPDKHVPDIDGIYTEKFKIIGESYSYLNNYIEDKDDYIENNDYNSIFSNFLSSMFSSNSDEISIIIKSIISDCQNLSVKLFENLDKDSAIKIFEFVNTFQHVLYIPKETVDKLKEIINKMNEPENIIILNPSLTDILIDNIFVLNYENEKYFIPLWHDEIYYNSKKGDNIVIKCMPELPDNISLDTNNNLIVRLSYLLSDIIKLTNLTYSIGNNNYNIPVEELRIKNLQYYIIKEKGISLIRQDN
ncbi:J domain-containing protein, partial [Candidatus Poseidonia alphae]|nr:J domain-containing protein [Candidatus Poseidonia alphae]